MPQRLGLALLLGGAAVAKMKLKPFHSSTSGADMECGVTFVLTDSSDVVPLSPDLIAAMATTNTTATCKLI